MNEDDQDDPMNVPISVITTGYGILFLGVLVLLLIAVFFYTAFQAPLFSTLQEAETLTTPSQRLSGQGIVLGFA